MQHLEVFLLWDNPGWDAWPSQIYPHPLPCINLSVPISPRRETHCGSDVSCPRTQRSALARAQTRTTRSGVQRTNHQATAPPIYVLIFYLLTYAIIIQVQSPILWSFPDICHRTRNVADLRSTKRLSGSKLTLHHLQPWQRKRLRQAATLLDKRASKRARGESANKRNLNFWRELSVVLVETLTRRWSRNVSPRVDYLTG